MRRRETAKVYLRDSAVSRAAICFLSFFLFFFFCLVLLFGEKTEGTRIRDESSVSDSLWAHTGLETYSQSADGIEGIQTEAARLRGARRSGHGFDRSTDKQMDNVSEIVPKSWLPFRRQSRAERSRAAPPLGKNFSTAPSRLISSD